MIQVFSEVANWLSQGSEESRTAIGRDGGNGVPTVVAGHVPGRLKANVYVDAVMAATKKSSVEDAVVMQCARETQKGEANKSVVHFSESSGGSVVNTVTPNGANSIPTLGSAT